MAANPTTLAVVAAALLREDGSVLLQKRSLLAQHGGLWEFPGGKVEAAEPPESALCRELTEELGITVDPAALDLIATAASQDDSPRRLVIDLYICRAWEGEPACLDGEEIGWFDPQEIAGLAMPPLDYPLAQGLCEVLREK